MNEDQTSPLNAESPGAGETPGVETVASKTEANAQHLPDDNAKAEISASALSALQEQNAVLSREIAELKDQHLRGRADFENTRKRLQRDKEEAIQFANKQILVDVIGIVDDFERAIRSSEASRDFQSLYDGIGLIEKQFIGMLERKWGIQRFDASGETFDPQRHEAVAAEPRADLPEQSILEVYQKGYLLHDKVLRTAKVKVSLPA